MVKAKAVVLVSAKRKGRDKYIIDESGKIWACKKRLSRRKIPGLERKSLSITPPVPPIT